MTNSSIMLRRISTDLFTPFLDRCHTRNFIVRFCRATKLQVWYGVSRNFSTVAQLIFRFEQRSILCNFVAKMRWTLIGQFLFMRQSCSMRHTTSHLRFCREIKLRDKIARLLQVWHRSYSCFLFIVFCNVFLSVFLFHFVVIGFFLANKVVYNWGLSGGLVHWLCCVPNFIAIHCRGHFIFRQNQCLKPNLPLKPKFKTEVWF